MRKRARKIVRYGVPAIALLAAALAAVLFATRSGGEVAASKPFAPPATAGTAERFAVLSKARSNQCGLRASALSAIARHGRLQGSCCSRMDLHRYREQVAGLRRYAGVPEIPRDPYDIPVTLAKRLISYDQGIELRNEQQAIYDRAMKLSDEGGPCCCRCWRWTAFEGQAKFLIARRGYGAAEIAEIWELEDGCGGSGHAGEHHS